MSKEVKNWLGERIFKPINNTDNFNTLFINRENFFQTLKLIGTYVPTQRNRLSQCVGPCFRIASVSEVKKGALMVSELLVSVVSKVSRMTCILHHKDEDFHF